MPRKTPGRRRRAAGAAGFNEAAARCRGKRGAWPPPPSMLAHQASMRPRPDAAENAAADRGDDGDVVALQ